MSNDNRIDDGVGELEPEARADKGDQSMSRKAISKQPWDVQIDIHLTKGCPNPQFAVYTTLPVVNGNVVFENNHRPGFNITFTLYDETGSNPPYTFPPQAHVRDACWSKVGNTCPTSACYEVFDPRHVDGSGTTLTVYNDNPSPALGDFKYTLRVTNDGGASYCDLDPGGTEMNGPR